MYKGKITELLGSELPIIQAPMAGVQDSALAIAVCEAGGLGSLPCGMLKCGQDCCRNQDDSGCDRQTVQPQFLLP